MKVKYYCSLTYLVKGSTVWGDVQTSHRLYDRELEGVKEPTVDRHDVCSVVHRDQRQCVSCSGGFLLSDCEVFESVFEVFDDFVLLALGDRATYRLSYVVKIDEHLKVFRR